MCISNERFRLAGAARRYSCWAAHRCLLQQQQLRRQLINRKIRGVNYAGAAFQMPISNVRGAGRYIARVALIYYNRP